MMQVSGVTHFERRGVLKTQSLFTALECRTEGYEYIRFMLPR